MSVNPISNSGAQRSVRVLVFDPIEENRKTLRQTLKSIGFRDADESQNLTQFQAALEFTPYDLVFAECCQDAGGEKGNHADLLATTIKSLRYGDVGLNPYLVVINTAWLLDKQLVSSIIGSGTDDLLARPFSTEAIKQRITLQINSRKGFVITSDYVGPDRRKNKHRASTAFKINVPNSLQAIINKDRERLSQLRTDIEATKATIIIEKMRRQPLSIGVIANQLSDASRDKATNLAGKEKLEKNFHDLLILTDDLNKRIGQTGFSQSESLSLTLHKLAGSMMKKFKSGDMLDTDELAQLKQHSTSLQIAFNPDETEDSIAMNISSVASRQPSIV